jgi:hypothetical protein
LRAAHLAASRLTLFAPHLIAVNCRPPEPHAVFAFSNQLTPIDGLSIADF